MATSLESPLTKLSQGSLSSPVFSPSSDKHFWATLRSRVDTLINNRKPPVDTKIDGLRNKSSTLKEDSLLLLRGFDSVAHSLSQLSDNLDNALQGARDLARPPTLTDLVQSAVANANAEEDKDGSNKNEEEDKRGMKRKLGSADEQEDSEKAIEKKPEEIGKFKRARNLAISMATKAATMARELKSIRSDLSFVQERCGLLEEENRKLRDGMAKGITPDDDDLVRLQLEALLAEKSRLANENANLTRENQCLHQLVEYHQLTSQDLSASYENLVKGMGLEFSTPEDTADECHDRILKMSNEGDMFGFCKSLDDCYGED